MKLRITSGLNDTKETISEDLPSDYMVPRIGDIIYLRNIRCIVDRVIIDYDYKEITVWVKDYTK